MKSESKARQLLDRAIGKARETKGAEAIVRLTEERSGNTRFAASQVTSAGEIERATLAVSVQLGQRVATASTNQLDDRAVDDAVARAVRLAKLVPDDPEAQAPLPSGKYAPAKGAVDAATDKAGPADRAKAVGAALAVAKDKSLAIAGFYQHGVRAVSLATSAGLWAHHELSSALLSCTARTSDGTGSGWAGQSAHRIGDIDAHALAARAADKALASAKPRRLDPGRYTVVLEPAAFAGLLAFLTDAFDARRADEGRSFFAKKAIGDALFDARITLRTDPTDAALATAPFDGEGLPVDKRAWIDKGKLGGLVYSRYWAAKQNEGRHRPAGRVDPRRRDQRSAQGRRQGRADHARVVPAHGRSAGAARHRADARRRVPDRQGRDRGSGEQLPVQRVARARARDVRRARGCRHPRRHRGLRHARAEAARARVQPREHLGGGMSTVDRDVNVDVDLNLSLNATLDLDLDDAWTTTTSTSTVEFRFKFRSTSTFESTSTSRSTISEAV